jgi:hypothetical protein
MRRANSGLVVNSVSSGTAAVRRRGPSALLLDGVEEVAELRRAVALLVLADDLARPSVEGGEEAGGAVALVVVSAPLHLAGAHGQQRRGSIEGLYLRLLVDAQNQRPVGRIQIQAHDVAHLVDEEWIATELEGLRSVRSEREGTPDAVIVDWLSPVALAMSRVDQCVADSGWLSSIRLKALR